MTEPEDPPPPLADRVTKSPRLTARDFHPDVLRLFDEYVHGLLDEDQRLQTEYLEIPSPLGYGKVRGYLAKPKKFAGKLPTLLVVHENRGLWNLEGGSAAIRYYSRGSPFRPCPRRQMPATRPCCRPPCAAP